MEVSTIADISDISESFMPDISLESLLELPLLELPLSGFPLSELSPQALAPRAMTAKAIGSQSLVLFVKVFFFLCSRFYISCKANSVAARSEPVHLKRRKSRTTTRDKTLPKREVCISDEINEPEPDARACRGKEDQSPKSRGYDH
ncbi:hypothetical protein [Rubrobacter radiotolerans]|uniref:Uncharacterized protein n=1 Tax=Rubrobacter radiotolerans TaxID=42256 RepID=A0AB35T890_RUBRA|nr:hypothetical protein [Rubrobacter radiotolerans]MDX5895167.1 hypothetical protein [Rubrobacter radiotolerans]